VRNQSLKKKQLNIFQPNVFGSRSNQGVFQNEALAQFLEKQLCYSRPRNQALKVV